jgi:thiol-disulfide isomerase/thioredoxin
MNKNVAVAIALIVVFIVGVTGYFVTATQEAPAPAAVMPEPEAATVPDENQAAVKVQFALNDVDGNLRDLAEWQGKARLINFWATWCAPCRREIPLLKQTQADHAADNVQIIGIAVDFPEEVQAYAEEAQFNYPILVGQEDAMAAAEDAGVPFIGLPFTMIVAPSGELLNSHVGEIMQSHIDSILEVFDGLETGRLDIAAAREALSEF